MVKEKTTGKYPVVFSFDIKFNKIFKASYMS